LERVVRAVDGVDRAVVNFAAARMNVEHHAHVGDAELGAAVLRAGFQVRSNEPAPRRVWWRSLRVVSLMSSAALFAAALAGSWQDDSTGVGWIAVFAAAIVAGGWPIFRSAVVGLRALHLDMNVLMAAATLGAAVLGAWAEAASIVLLFSLGNLLQIHAVARTRDAVSSLGMLTPDTVHLLVDGSSVATPVAQVDVGAHILVRPGERIAVDGVVVEGVTTVDEAPITGESTPVEKAVGDSVLSGSLNGAGAVTVEVQRSAADSTLQQVVRMVEQAQATKAPSELFVDRFSRVYTPLVTLAAVVLAVVPSLVTDDWMTWTYRALALLIIACPCSLVISTPVTVVSGIGAASRRGILIKGGEALEAAGKMRALAIDKTGTLTEGRPTLATTTLLGRADAEAVLRIAGALERRSRSRETACGSFERGGRAELNEGCRSRPAHETARSNKEPEAGAEQERPRAGGAHTLKTRRQADARERRGDEPGGEVMQAA